MLIGEGAMVFIFVKHFQKHGKTLKKAKSLLLPENEKKW